jgi:signal transduction histidine kinase
VLDTGRPARIDSYDHVPGAIADTLRRIGIRAAIGAPIVVAGRTWGVMTATSKSEAGFPEAAESRLQEFTELLATAISNASARDKARVLAEGHAALRRVATLVAQQNPQAEVFKAIAEEIGTLLGVDSTAMVRYEEGRCGVLVASAGPSAAAIPVGTRTPLGESSVTSLVRSTGRPARVDREEAGGPIADELLAAGVRSVVGAPIVVEGRLWGAMLAGTHNAPPPADTESRIEEFTELMATAIANAEARAEAARLADEQAALRRVATLVAQGAPPATVFEAAAREVAQLLDASAVTLARYEDDMVAVVAQHGNDYVGAGDRFPLGGTNVASIVRRTGRTARLDAVEEATGAIGDHVRRAAGRSAVAAPVIVNDRTWGVLAAIWKDRGPPPDDTEERLDSFAKLLDTAIANADSRNELTASRARVLAASDEARRRVVRDLHDGAQQRLVHTIVTLNLAREALRADGGTADALLAEALDTAERATAEVRELAHGILPSVLVHSGLRAGVDAFASRLDLPVALEVTRERLPADIEASAYFIFAEALTNVVKHARATRGVVKAGVEDGVLALEVSDDGVGGADPMGHGLVGIADRVDALGGTVSITSAEGDGTVVAVRLPVSTGRRTARTEAVGDEGGHTPEAAPRPVAND